MTRRTAARPAHGSRLGARLLLVLSGTVIAVLLSEGLVRLLAPQITSCAGRFFEPDSEVGHVLAAGYDGEFSNAVEFSTRVRTNAHRLRGGPLRRSGPRVLGIGDSFMFGYGVEEEETFLARASRTIGAEPLNAGVPGYGVCQAVARARTLVPELAPDVLVVSIFLGNDELDALRGANASQVEDRMLVATDRKLPPWRALTHPLYRRLHLVRFLTTGPPGVLIRTRFLGQPVETRNSFRDLLRTYEVPTPDEIPAADERIGACLESLSIVARGRRIPVLGIVVPEAIEVDSNHLTRAAALAGSPPQTLDLDAPRRRLSLRLLEAGITIVDPRDALHAAAASGHQLYFELDRHLTPDGNAGVAKVLAGPLADALGRARPLNAPDGT